MIRTYSELIKIESFRARYEYLRLGGRVGEDTFGFDRYLNQIFYKSPEWKRLRDKVIVRDRGRDLAMIGHEIPGRIFVHHMNPVTLEDIDKREPDILNPDFLVCCSLDTHNAIHYGDVNFLPEEWEERKPNDTCPWKM